MCGTSNEPLALFYHRYITWFVCCFFLLLLLLLCSFSWSSIDQVGKLLSRCLISFVRIQSDCSHVLHYEWFAFPLNVNWTQVAVFKALHHGFHLNSTVAIFETYIIRKSVTSWWLTIKGLFALNTPRHLCHEYLKESP